MAPTDFPEKLTHDDYLQIPEDGQRHEIIDGELYVSPTPSIRHQEISSNLHSILGPYIRAHRLGRLYAAPTDVLMSRHDVVQPDLLFVSQERLGIITEANIKGAPDLVIEIHSKRTRLRDEGVKRECYERLGVREYWTVDPDRKAIRVYLLKGDVLLLTVRFTATAGDILTTPLLPGLEIPLAEVFP